MLLWLQSLQIYLAIPEMKSDISWMLLCLYSQPLTVLTLRLMEEVYSQPLTVLTLRLMEEVVKLRGFLNVLEKVCCILNAKSSFLMTVFF